MDTNRRPAGPAAPKRGERLPRGLLRLYPCDWRERYGDEFLALIDEFGLTWRSAADIVRAAAAERTHRLVRLARAETVPTDPLPPFRPSTGREFLFVRAGLIPLVGLTVVALNTFGIPYPHWGAWIQLMALPLLLFDEESRVTDATIGERIVLTFAWLLVSLFLVGAGFAAGNGLQSFGVSASPGIVFLATLTVLLAGVVRFLYRFVCSNLNKPRPDLTVREIASWHVALFAMIVMAGAAASSGTFFWSMMITCFIWMRFTYVRLVRASRWRQVREQRGF
jgi:hypothetical protein